MSNIIILSYFIGPLITIFFLIYMNLRFKLKTNKFLLYAFIFGIISAAIVVASQVVMDSTQINYLKNLKRTAFYAIIVIALFSEVGKFIILRYIFLPKKDFRGPIDGIIYSIFIGMGFATAATILLSYHFISAEVNYLYIFTYAIANFIFAIILGFFVGLGKIRENRFIDSMTGLFASTIFHGLYTFSFLTSDHRLLILFAMGSMIIIILLTAKALSIKARSEPTETST